jgi:tetratricopeptide (TPR) repeat protein
MRIVQIEPPSPSLQGDQIYRTVQPCRALGLLPQTQVQSGAWLSAAIQAAAQDADVLIVCQAADVDLLPLWTQRTREGRCNVFEINDHFAALQPWNKAAAFYHNPLIRSLTYQLAHTACALQFSSHGLQETFGHLNAHHHVFVNQLWRLSPAPSRPSTPRSGSPLRLGWGGSLGHRDDIAAVVPVIAEIMRRHPQVVWAAMAPQELHAVFAPLPAARCELRGLGDTAAYRSFLQTLDVGLAPLQDTPFNRCRSDVKYLEYVDAGVAPIVQAARPYADSVRHGEVGLVFADPAKLLGCIESLLLDAPLRHRLVAQARQEVGLGRLQVHHAAAQRAFYEECLQQQRRHGPAAPAAAALQRRGGCTEAGGPRSGGTNANELRSANAGTCGRQGDNAQASMPHGDNAHAKEAGSRDAVAVQRNGDPVVAGSYSAIPLQPAEAELYRGLLLRHTPPRALAHYAAASALQPQAYLPHLYTGQLLPDRVAAQQALQRALALQPRSIAAWHTLAGRHLAAQDFAQMATAMQSLLAVEPSFAPAHEALGNLALQDQQTALAQQHFERALAANPYYRVAAARLAVLLLQQGKSPAAEALLQGSLQLQEDTWLEHYLLGDALHARSAYSQAQRHLRRALRLAPDRRPVVALLAKVLLAQGHVQQARSLLRAEAPLPGNGPAREEI